MLNHFPIFGFAIGVLLMAWATSRKSDEVARAGLALFFLAGISAVLVFFSGEGAEEVVESIVGVSEDAIEAHEELGELGMFVSVGVGLAAAVVLGFSWKRTVKGWLVRVFLLAGLITFGILGYAGLLGGRIHHEEIRPAVAVAWTGPSEGGWRGPSSQFPGATSRTTT